MINNFGDTMKKLRKSRDLTQEQLAEYLGVSFQAVSKWETNAAYPDIALFPIIANFFGVTTDELLGVDISQSKQKQDEYTRILWELFNEWKTTEMVELSRKACHEFPGNHEMLDNLAWSLELTQNESANLDEAIVISKKILDESTDSRLRLRATVRLCNCFNASGNKTTALEYANKLPNFPHTKQYMIGRLGLESGYAQIEFAQQCIQSYAEALNEVLVQFADIGYGNPENNLSHDERIGLLQNALEIQRIVYGDTLCDRHFDAYEYNRIIACIYLLTERNDSALVHLEIAYNHAKSFTEYNDGEKYKSLAMKDKAAEPHSRWSRNPLDDMRERLETQSRYDAIRNDPRFIGIIDKLTAQ